jgi:cytochrome P450
MTMLATPHGSLDQALVSPEFVVDPYPLLKQLRIEDPVHWSESMGAWVLTRYQDIMVTLKETGSFSNENRLGRASAYLPPETRAKLQRFEDHYKTKGLLHSDAPDHTRLRKLFLTAFTPRVVESMRPRIQQIVDELLDAVQHKGRMEVIDELAFRLPVTVLCDILGVPHSDAPKFRRWADDLLAFQGNNRPGENVLLKAQDTLVEGRAYLQDMINKARAGNDTALIGRMVAAEADGGKLTEAEIINTCVTLLVAGHETTTSLIGNGLVCLLTHPQQWELVKRNPDELLKPAIEEILRFESPVARQPRVMKTDYVLGGKTFKQGQMCMQMLNSANRDESIFANPDTFDVTRQDNKHIAFGFGPHFCIGAALSRMEGHVVFGTILNRMPNIRLADPDVAWDPTKPNSRVLKHLHVTF